MSTRLGDLLFSLRRRRRLLQKVVAATAGIDASYLAGLERGRKETPTLRVLDRILSAVQASAKDRAAARRALTSAQIQRVLENSAEPLPGAESLVRLAEQLPELSDDEIQLVESVVAVIGKKKGQEEVAM